MNDIPLSNNVHNILQKFNITDPKVLGKGGEGVIIDFGDKALKIYENATEEYLLSIFNFQNLLSKYKLSFETPQIIEIGSHENIYYTIERKLNGKQIDKIFPSLGPNERQLLFKRYYEALKEINSITFSDYLYGQIIKTPECITSDNWVDFLIRKLNQKVEKAQSRYMETVRDFKQKALLLESLIRKNIHNEEKRLVHSDYYLNNVLVSNNLQISAVLDFSVHAVVGDPRFDVSSVLTWNTINSNIHSDDYNFLYEIAQKDYGDDLRKYIDIYFLYSSFYYSDMDDPSFCINNLNQEQVWRRLI